MELSRTMIFAKDMQRMTAFYRDGIGLRLLEEKSQEGWAELEAGAVMLVLHGIPAEIAKDIHVTSPPKRRGSDAHQARISNPGRRAGARPI